MERNKKFIDIHTHLFTEEAYAEYRTKASTRAEKIISIQYWTANEPPRYPLETLLDFAAGKNIFIVAAVNIYFDIAEQLQKLELVKDRIAGVKMYPGYQYFYPSDELVHPVAEFCGRHDLPLVFHSGTTSARGAPLLKYALPIHIDELATKYPSSKIIIAHFGFPHLLETAAVVSKHANVYTDISGTIEKPASPEALKRILARYKNDVSRTVDYFPDITSKIMFGTDYSGEHSHLNEVDPYIELVESIFSEKEQEDIFYNTANRVFRK